MFINDPVVAGCLLSNSNPDKL